MSNVSRTCVKAWLSQPLIPCLCSAWLFENLLLVVVLRASEPTEASDCWRKLWHFIKATTESTIPARPIHIATENNNKQRESWVSCQRITPGGILQRNVPLILNVKIHQNNSGSYFSRAHACLPEILRIWCCYTLERSNGEVVLVCTNSSKIKTKYITLPQPT